MFDIRIFPYPDIRHCIIFICIVAASSTYQRSQVSNASLFQLKATKTSPTDKQGTKFSLLFPACLAKQKINAC